MARRARFGRQPRAQQNINSTLVSIAREMQANRDANIMDAWKNGGEFEGKPVTDEMALAYWKKRGSTLDKKDPTYDRSQDEIMQLQYAIEQSKQDLLHVQGKLSDQAYANFFLKWAKKVPQHSEFWRSLQKDAAGLIQSAKAKAKRDAENARADAFNKFTANLQQHGSIAVSDALQAAMKQVAAESGLDMEGDGERILSILSADFKGNPDKYRKLQDALKTGAPGFNGNFTTAFVRQQVDAAEASYGRIATRAAKEGYATAYANAASNQSETAGFGSSLKLWGPAQAYDKAYDALQRTWSDPNASQEDKWAAANTFSATVGKLANTPGIPPEDKAMLQADAARAIGQDGGNGPSFGSVLGRNVMTQEFAAETKHIAELKAAKAAAPNDYVYAPTDANGNFDPKGAGPVGIVPRSAVPADAALVAVPGLNGKMQMTYIPTHEMLVQDPFDPKKTTPAGLVATYTIGGKQMMLTSAINAQGKQVWTTANPVAGGGSASFDNNNNLVITPPPPSPEDVLAAAQKLQDEHPGIDFVSKVTEALRNGGSATATLDGRTPVTDAEGNVRPGLTSTVTLTYENGQFKVKTGEFSYDANGQRQEAGGNTTTMSVYQAGDNVRRGIDQTLLVTDHPGITFSSSLTASTAFASDTMSQRQLASLAQDPEFQYAFVQETTKALGTTDPTDPRVVSAWNDLIGRADERLAPRPRMQGTAPQARNDLTFPGQEAKHPSQVSPTINFNGQTIRIPDMPAYMQGRAEAAVSGAAPPLYIAGADAYSNTILGKGGAVSKTTVSPTSGAAVVTPIKPAVTPAPMTQTPGSGITPLASYGSGPGGVTPVSVTPAPATKPKNTDPLHPTYGGNQEY